MGNPGRWAVVVALAFSVFGACPVPPSTARPSKAKSQEIGIEASQSLRLLPSVPDYPIETAAGTVFWNGSEYVAVIPGWRMGLYWLRIPEDGGRPVVHLPEDAGHSLGDVDPVIASRAIDGGAIILQRSALIRIDDQGRRIAVRPHVGEADGQKLLSANRIHFLAREWRDGGASLEEIGIDDGGLSIVRTVGLSAPASLQVRSVSGSVVAVVSSGVVGTIHLLDRNTGALAGSMVVPVPSGFEVGPAPTGFVVFWVENGAVMSRPLDRSAQWLAPASVFSPGPAYAVNSPHPLQDGGLLVSWRYQQSMSFATAGGSPTQLPLLSFGGLSCDGPTCVVLTDGTAYFFAAGSPASPARRLVHVTPWQIPTPFSWNGRVWVGIREDAESAWTTRERLTVFSPDAGRVEDVTWLPALQQETVVVGSHQGPALRTDGTVFHLMTEVDGGVLVGPLRPLQTAGSPPVAPRVFAHEGAFLVMWGASGNGFTVLDSAGNVLIPAQSIPRPVSHDQVWVGTPPGEFWLTFRGFPVGSPLEVLRIALRDGGLAFGTPPGLAISSSPDVTLMQTELGFQLLAHDGGLSAPFTPVRVGPTVWNGSEFQIFPGPSRVVEGTVVDTNLVPWPFGSQGKVASDGRGLTLQTLVELEWDWLQGRTIWRAHGFEIRNALLLLGRPCALDSDCASSHCVDSVCCESTCGGGALDCQACSVRQGSSTVDGTCGPALSSITCRWDQDLCDAPESCDGVSTVCPADRVHDAGFVCRRAFQVCDEPEVCDGVTAVCPVDVASTQGEPCDDENECTVNDACAGMYSGQCVGTPRTGSCNAGWQCTVGDSCQNGFCVRGPYCPAAECQEAVGCGSSGCLFGPAPDGTGCDAGTCVAGVCTADAGVVIDAGLNAGSGDAGTRDGGVPDAGTSLDAGLQLDAGDAEVDGGATHDSGVPDAGAITVSDAGASPDAGVSLDAGVDGGGAPRDAGASASPPEDAGIDDGGTALQLPAAGVESRPLPSSGCTGSGGDALSLLTLLLLTRRRRFRQSRAYCWW